MTSYMVCLYRKYRLSSTYEKYKTTEFAISSEYVPYTDKFALNVQCLTK